MITFEYMKKYINFVEEVNVGHLEVNHRHQAHHAEGYKIVHLVNVSGIEELQNACVLGECFLKVLNQIFC